MKGSSNTLKIIIKILKQNTLHERLEEKGQKHIPTNMKPSHQLQTKTAEKTASAVGSKLAKDKSTNLLTLIHEQRQA
jgi:hypothetical protein